MPANLPDLALDVSDAVLDRVIVAGRDRVHLLIADCETCHRSVTHGGGFIAADLADFLGSRSAHCACSVTNLVDPHGVIAAFQNGSVA